MLSRTLLFWKYRLLLLYINIVHISAEVAPRITPKPTDVTELNWSFLVFADWHGAESFAVNPVNDTFSNNTFYNDTLEVLTHINQTYGGDLVILPGDTNNGKWYLKNFHDQLNYYLGIHSLTDNEAIEIGGRNCYSTVKRLFSEAGYDKLLATVGDHEIG